MRAHLAVLALSHAVPLCALAAPPTSTPAAETRPGATPRAPDVPDARPRREPPLHFVLQGGLDFGSTKLADVTLSDGTTRSIRANQGLSLAVGAAFLKIAGGRVAIQATIGVEGWDLDASGGGAFWRAFPIEVMEVFYLGPIRLGAGVSYLLSPSLDGKGALESVDVRYENSLGLLFRADWVVRDAGSARGGRLTFGPRLVIQKLTPKVPGAEAIDANSFGVVLGFTG
jgi:hypothetical protein